MNHEEKYFIFLRRIIQRINKSSNNVILINGAPGSGKSYIGLRLLEDLQNYFAEEGFYEKGFEIKNKVSFSFSKMLDLMNLKQNQGAGQCFLFEEVGSITSEAGSNSWQSKANCFFSSFLQTNRCKRQIIIFTCPSYQDLDSRARRLINFQVTVNGVNPRKKVGICNVYQIQTDFKNEKGKTYRKHLVLANNYGIANKLSKPYEIKKPPEDIIKEYEKLKASYLKKLNDFIRSDESDKKNKGKRQKNGLTKKSVFKLSQNGLSQSEIAEILQIDKSTVNKHLHT